MPLSCKICKMNNEQEYNNCGYIDSSLHNPNKFYDFSLYKNPNFGVTECPVYYYNEYIYLYEIYNLIKASSLNLMKEPFMIRFIYKIFSEVIELQIKKNNDDYKRKNKR